MSNLNPTAEQIEAAYRNGARVRVSYVVMADQPRSEFTARLIATDGDTAYYTTDGVWYSRATRSESVAWEIETDDAWEVALLGEAYQHGMCTVAGCEQVATYTDLHWAAAGHQPYRCAAHADTEHQSCAAPTTERVRAVGWDWGTLSLFLLPSSGLTHENRYWAALMRDALPTPAEARARRAMAVVRYATRGGYPMPEWAAQVAIDLSTAQAAARTN